MLAAWKKEKVWLFPLRRVHALFHDSENAVVSYRSGCGYTQLISELQVSGISGSDKISHFVKITSSNDGCKISIAGIYTRIKPNISSNSLDPIYWISFHLLTNCT